MDSAAEALWNQGSNFMTPAPAPNGWFTWSGSFCWWGASCRRRLRSWWFFDRCWWTWDLMGMIQGIRLKNWTIELFIPFDSLFFLDWMIACYQSMLPSSRWMRLQLDPSWHVQSARWRVQNWVARLPPLRKSTVDVGSSYYTIPHILFWQNCRCCYQYGHHHHHHHRRHHRHHHHHHHHSTISLWFRIHWKCRGWSVYRMSRTDPYWAQHGAIMGLQLAEQLEMEKTERKPTANVNFPIFSYCLDLFGSFAIFLCFPYILLRHAVGPTIRARALGVERCLTLCEDSEGPCFETPYSSQAMAMAEGCRGPARICGDCIGWYGYYISIIIYLLYVFIIVTTLLLILSWLIVIDAMEPAVGRPSPSFVWASSPKMLRIWRRWLRGVLVNKVCQYCPVRFQEEIQQNNTNSEIWWVCVQLQPLFDTGHVCKFRASPYWSISLFRPNKSGDTLATRRWNVDFACCTELILRSV